MTTGFIALNGEFLVNTITTSDQTAGSIAAFADGGFIVTWQDNSQTGYDTSAVGIYAQIYNADGTKNGGEFAVNTTISSTQSNPSVTVLANGGFVITWEDDSRTTGDTSFFAIRAQMYYPNGTLNGSEFVVNSVTTSYQTSPEITALSSGGFAITWQDNSQSGNDDSNYAVRMRIFDADGDALATDILVNTTTADKQRDPSIDELSNGNIIVTWEDYSGSGGDTSGWAIRAQLFSSTGAFVGTEFLVNTTVSNWQENPSVTALTGGGFVISWQDSSQTGGDTSNNAIRAQMFDATGKTVGGEFLVNTSTTNNQQEPAIAGLADGGYVIVWEDLVADGSGYGVFGQRFSADGVAVGGETLINSTTSGNQQNVDVEALADGGFIVTWEDSTGIDGSGKGVFAQTFAAQTFGTNAKEKLVGDADDNWINGLGGNDTLKGFNGSDILYGDLGRDKLFGGKGSDTLYGGKGNDTLNGEKGTDVLKGGYGADTINGGAGKDVLTGGAGSDTFVFHEGESTRTKYDTITDFASSIDTIDLRSLSFGLNYIGSDAFSENGQDEFRAVVVEGDIQIRVDMGGDGTVDMKIFLEGITSISESDFNYFNL